MFVHSGARTSPHRKPTTTEERETGENRPASDGNDVGKGGKVTAGSTHTHTLSDETDEESDESRGSDVNRHERDGTESGII